MIIMRIPSDSEAFKHIDTTWQEFALEPHHMKLGVGLDGINPFSMRSSKWSTWSGGSYQLQPIAIYVYQEGALDIIFTNSR